MYVSSTFLCNKLPKFRAGQIVPFLNIMFSPLNKIALIKTNFPISRPKHTLWVLEGNVSISTHRKY